MNKKIIFGIIGYLAVAFQSCGNEDVMPPLPYKIIKTKLPPPC